MEKSLQDEIVAHIEKAKIVEVLFRYCRALDRRDRELLKSVFHPDAYDQHSFFAGNAWEFADFVCDNSATLGNTVHVVTNYLIELDGDVAYCESYGVACDQNAQIEGEKTFLLAVGRNLDRFEKRNGEWRIAERRIVYDVNQRAPVNESWTGEWFGKWKPRGTDAPNDPVYHIKDLGPRR